METIIDATKTLDTKTIDFQTVKVLSNGSKSVNIRSKSTKNAFRFAAPLMLTWVLPTMKATSLN